MRRRALTAVVALIIAIGLVMPLSACNILSSLTSQIKTVSSVLTEPELARLLTDAIISDNNVADSYSAISDKQLDGVTYTAFSEYCSILRGMSVKHGNVTSFRILNADEANEYFDDIGSSIDNIKSLDEYGNLSVVELCYDDDTQPLTPCRFVLKQSSDGTYMLAGSYISDSIVAYDYISHYFSMISDKNINALEAILAPTYASDLYLSSVIAAKADYIVDYYTLKVKSSVDDYQLVTLSPVLVSFEIPETVDVDDVSVIPHDVSLYINSNNTFFINDLIPAEDDGQLYLCDSNSRLLTCGASFTNELLTATMGDPKYYVRGVDIIDSKIDSDGNSYNLYRLVAVYDGVTIAFNVRYTSDDKTAWEGDIVSIKLFGDGDYTIGNNIYYGMNLSELMLIYPVIDEYGFIYSYVYDGETYNMTFEYDENYNITQIKVSEAE